MLEMNTELGKVRQDCAKSIVNSLNESNDRCNSEIVEKKIYVCRWMEKLNGDFSNLCLLVFLYILVAIPLSFTQTVPLILQNRGVSYSEQAQFSFVHWPWMLKILWGPIADAIPSNKFGKHKTLLVPVQYLLGIIMLVISMNISTWLGDPSKGQRPNMFMLTIMFLPCYTLAAVQDVVVDGWAITMLSPKNVGHSSTCTAIGFGIGAFLGYIVSITLDSAEFCNKWLRSTPQPIGCVPLSYSIGFYGLVYIIVTTLFAIYKKEEKFILENEEQKVVMNTKQSYIVLWEILKLKPMWNYFWLMLSLGVVCAACNAVAPLKLMEIGFPRGKFVMMDVPLGPIHVVLPFILSRYSVSDQPLNILLTAVPYWLITSILFAVLIYIAPVCKINNEFPSWYFGILFLLHIFHKSINFCISIAQGAFNAQNSDPRWASTHMTCMHTIKSVSIMIPGTVAIWLVNRLTWKNCTEICIDDTKICILEDTCHVIVDGFYVEIFLCTMLGIGWLLWAKGEFNELHNLKRSAWLLKNSFFNKY